MKVPDTAATSGLWVPEEMEPDGGWAPAPDIMPLLVSEWERSDDQGGGGEARPQRLTTPRSVVALKDDTYSGRERVRRFVQAWRWLNELRQRPGPVVVRGQECNKYLAGAGVLVRIRPPAL